MTTRRSHQIVFVDASRRDEFLGLWPNLIKAFRSSAKPGEHCTVAAVVVDASRVDTVLPSTRVATAPDSLTLPALTAGSGPDDVADRLLRIVIDAQVHLDEPNIVVHMFADPQWDRTRLSAVQSLPNVRIVSNALGSRRKLLESRAAKVVAAIVLTIFLLIFLRWLGAPQPAPATATSGPPSSTTAPPPVVVNDSSWNVAAIQALQVDQCINSYPYPSALNRAPFSVVDCSSPGATLQFISSAPANANDDGSTCSKSIENSWQYGSQVYCFRYMLRPGMCVPADTRKAAEGHIYAQFNSPAACGDPFNNTLRIRPEAQGSIYVDLVIDSTAPTSNPVHCADLEYIVDDVGLQVCAHLR